MMNVFTVMMVDRYGDGCNDLRGDDDDDGDDDLVSNRTRTKYLIKSITLLLQE